MPRWAVASVSTRSSCNRCRDDERKWHIKRFRDGERLLRTHLEVPSLVNWLHRPSKELLVVSVSLTWMLPYLLLRFSYLLIYLEDGSVGIHILFPMLARCP